VARVQLALNVSDLEAAIAFYSKLFGVEPAKRRPGYANFAVPEPPLKLVLFEKAESPGLGIEVTTSADVQAAGARLAAAGLTTQSEEGTNCCFAIQDKVWVADPDGATWEVYTVLEDAPAPCGCGHEVVAPAIDTDAGTDATCC
jgi:catechol 2,3-dioxygenase-like lactoylglutathione lyase family enzyme